uniref:Putative DNA-binding protein n=1 Tax=Bifidobacterium animalis TaxID=28025 RepID=Q93LB1_9BIFI|nr:putative DNA-binding protein [Bifidobacterium animalis]
MGGGRPGGARAGHAVARAGRPVLLGARDRRGRARVAPRRVRRPVRDRDRRPDPALRRQAGKTAGHGAGPFRPGASRMDAGARRRVHKTRRGGRHGRVRRLEAGRRIRRAPRGRGHRPVPRRATGRRPRHQGALPPATRRHRQARCQGRQALRLQARPADQRRIPRRTRPCQTHGPVRHPGQPRPHARPRRLPKGHTRLPVRRQATRRTHDARADRRPDRTGALQRLPGTRLPRPRAQKTHARHPRPLPPPPLKQRTHRSHQRQARDPARQRHGLRQHHQLHPTMPHPQQPTQRHPYTLT